MTETLTAGAMPVVEGAKPSQSAETNAAPESLATGDPEALGEAGTRALAAERKRANEADKARRAAEARLAELESASKSETEKAIEQARKEGATEALTRANERVRRSEVRAALTTAGVNPALLEIASRADEFSALKVDDDGEVTGLAAAVEAVRKAMPDLFKATARPDFGGGPRGQTPTSAPSMNELLRAAAKGG